MTFYRDDRLALFIDGANLYSTAKALNIEIDYRKLLDSFKKRGKLVRAYYYTAIISGDDVYSPIKKLVDWLDYNGFKVVTKPAREYYDNQGRKRFKGDMDVDLAMDMLELSQHLDHVVLFSGDGDFKRVVQAMQDRGVRVSVVSTISGGQSMIADDLRRCADNFIDLADLAELIARPPREAEPDDEQYEDDADDDAA